MEETMRRHIENLKAELVELHQMRSTLQVQAKTEFVKNMLHYNEQRIREVKLAIEVEEAAIARDEKLTEGLLPSRQSKLQCKAVMLFLAEGGIQLDEPCDCGSHVRHNNGGNYHKVLRVRADSGKFYIQHDITYEDSTPSDWTDHPISDVLGLIVDKASDGWWPSSLSVKT